MPDSSSNPSSNQITLGGQLTAVGFNDRATMNHHQLSDFITDRFRQHTILFLSTLKVKKNFRILNIHSLTLILNKNTFAKHFRSAANSTHP